MGALNFINSNPAAATFNTNMDAMDRREAADDAAIQRRYAFEEGIRQQNALNDAANSVQSLFGTGQQPGAPATPQGQPVPMPAAPNPDAAAQPATALSTVTAAPAPAPRVGRAAVLAAMPQNKYTAASRLQMGQQIAGANDAAAAKATADASDHVFQLIKAGGAANIAMARQLAGQSGLQIPDAFWTDAKAQARLMGLVDAAHKMGLRGDQIPAYFSNMQKAGVDLPPEAAAAAAIPKGLAWKAGAGGGVGGASKQQQYAQWRIDTLVSSGVPEQDARRMVAAGSAMRPPNQAERMRLGQTLVKNSLGDLTINQAIAQVDEAIGAMPVIPGMPPPSGATPKPAGLPAGATQVGTKGGKPVYEFTDPTTNQRRRVVAQ